MMVVSTTEDNSQDIVTYMLDVNYETLYFLDFGISPPPELPGSGIIVKVFATANNGTHLEVTCVEVSGIPWRARTAHCISPLLAAVILGCFVA